MPEEEGKKRENEGNTRETDPICRRRREMQKGDISGGRSRIAIKNMRVPTGRRSRIDWALLRTILLNRLSSAKNRRVVPDAA
jgi:hypothetical protein